MTYEQRRILQIRAQLSAIDAQVNELLSELSTLEDGENYAIQDIRQLTLRAALASDNLTP